MPHSIEPATSGRAKCRGCGRPIGKGELRLGERLPNPYADGEMTLWFHPTCAAYKRPEALLEALAATGVAVDARDALEAARKSLGHRRLPRIDRVERAPRQEKALRPVRGVQGEPCPELVEAQPPSPSLAYLGHGVRRDDPGPRQDAVQTRYTLVFKGVRTGSHRPASLYGTPLPPRLRRVYLLTTWGGTISQTCAD